MTLAKELSYNNGAPLNHRIKQQQQTNKHLNGKDH